MAGARTWEPGAVRRSLGGLVHDDLLAAFEKLTAEDGCPADEAHKLLGDPGVVQKLIDSGLAHVGTASPEPPRLVPAPPDMAMEAALKRTQNELIAQCERLIDGHRRLSDMTRHQSHTGEVGGPLVELIKDREEITRRSHSLVNVARDDWMSLDNSQFDTALDEATGYAPPAIQVNVRHRTIYESKLMKNRVGARIIENLAAQGEQARLLPQVRMKMKLADASVAMLPLNPTGMEGALIIRSAVIAGALREYFELLWERALPVGAKPDPTSGLPESEREVLHLLAQGLTDKEIAARLRVSETTVHRRTESIRKRLGADTRFAAAVAAMRRGWIT
jgi:DNA-binding CsgD family transcriptional regulator